MRIKYFLSLLICLFLFNNLYSSELYQYVDDSYIELNINDIERYDQRLYIINNIYNCSLYNIELSEHDGIFYVSYSEDNSDKTDLKNSFDMFYNELCKDLKQMTKDEIGDLIYEYKNNLPSEFYHHIMMDFYRQSRENNLCSSALPFCTDNGLYIFPAGVNAGQGEEGPNYDCLSSTPNPAWYYMRIDDPGNINIYMYSEPQEDIDFCCWGPFTDPIEPCPNGLTNNKVVSCSYSSNATETCVIPNSSQTGEYYILIITNYSNNECNIYFEKQSGNGTTDCSILPPLINSNTPVCVGETLQLEAQQINNAIYNWTGPGGWTSNQRNPSRSNVTMNMAGIYSCNITVDNQQSEPVTTEVEIFAKATADFTNTNVCEGSPTQFTCTSTSNPANNIITRVWDFGDGNTGSGTNPSHTYTESGTYNVSLTVSTGGDCEDTKTKIVTVYNSPDADAGPDQTIDYAENATLSGNAGEGDFSYRWEPADLVINPNNTVTQTVELTTSVQFTFTATNTQGDCIDSDNVTINVNGSQMTAFITTDNSIICDTESSHLNVNVTGGTSSYSYSWSPTTGLDNPNIPNPIFTPGSIENSSESFIFTCTVNDGQTVVEPNITIVVNKSYTDEIIEASVCQGFNNGIYQEYNFNLSTMEYGTFQEVNELKNINGCDSIVTLILKVNPTYNDDFNTIDIYDEVCYSDEIYSNYGFNINIQDFTIPEESSFIYSESHDDISQYGCDSITNLNLTINKTYSEEYMTIVHDTIETCDEDIIWGDMTISETGDYEHIFTTNSSCDSLVKLHYVRNYETSETIIDTICNDNYSQNNTYNLYEWSFNYPGYYSGTKERLNENNCKMIVNYDLLLLNKLYASEISDTHSEIVYFTGTGFDFFDFKIDEVSGGGTDEIIDGFTNTQESYEWSVYMIDGENKWSCKQNNANNTTVNVTGPGAAYLYCDITSLCETVRKWVVLYTPGYKPCDDASNLHINIISNDWAELSWISPADSCLICYGTDTNCSNNIVTSQKDFILDDLTANTTYYWKVKSLCEYETDFIEGPSFTTKSEVGLDDNFINNIVIYPNPALDILNIKGDNIKLIKVYNSMGQMISSKDNINENITSIDTYSLNKGLYFVKILLNDEKSIVKRFIKE